ncbi:hypothetical protein GCM10008964_14790 [Methylophaga marina]|uniref:Uncharacterized protein n=1 Tax=Methylophaga marina TaxID=45495 RepID=A0ABN0TKQ5_9GAMM
MQRELAIAGVKAFMQIVGQNAELVFRHVFKSNVLVSTEHYPA